MPPIRAVAAAFSIAQTPAGFADLQARLARQGIPRERILVVLEATNPYLFISYASADRERVLPVVDALNRAGVSVWIDRESIRGGENYGTVIADAVKVSAAVLLMASSLSLASRNVKQEIGLGWRGAKTYPPPLLENAESAYRSGLASAGGRRYTHRSVAARRGSLLSLQALLAHRYKVRVAPFPVRWIAGSLQFGAPPSERGGARTETAHQKGE